MKEPTDIFGYSNELSHYGTPRHSGRYPYGSGENPYQHAAYFMNEVKKYRNQGLKDSDIQKIFNMSSTEFRARVSNSKEELYAKNVRQAQKLYDKGYSKVAIGKIMGVPDTTVGNYLRSNLEKRKTKNQNTADILEKTVADKGMIDVSSGVEKVLGVTSTCLTNSLAILKDKGYGVYSVYVEQPTNKDQYTTIKILANKGMTKEYVNKNRLDVKPFIDYHSEDGGETYNKLQPPKSLDSKRIKILRKNEESADGRTGVDRDGLIQIRRGVPDISLGSDLYAQVRIAVDDKYYMKGMAVYGDDSIFPDGVDVIWNTNKTKDNIYDILKPMKTVKVKNEDGTETEEVDKDNPFGAVIKDVNAGGQSYYTDSNGEKQLSVINKIKSEGDWAEYRKKLSSQFLGKQSKDLIKNQLNLSLKDKELELEEIMSIENEAIKKKLLKSFADGCDKSAIDLKAAALPRQMTQVILPDPNLTENEIYAPNYKNGEYVALVRYPHGGTFEIPILKVNNNVKSSKMMLGNGEDTAQDAVCINPKVAGRLSGADFDGDTVMVLPTNGSNGINIISTKPLEKLKDFDPQESYPSREGMAVMSEEYKQKQMGIVSNLITDMTLLGADPDELARATRHSMVVIDAVKHKLDYKASYEDNGIAKLQEEYQGKVGGGAATLLSRAKSQERVNFRKEGQFIEDENGKKKLYYYDPETGDKLYRDVDKTRMKLPKKYRDQIKEIKKDDSISDSEKQAMINSIYSDYGSEEQVQIISTKMGEHKDARDLISKFQTPQEKLYANYANSLKDLARKSRLSILDTPNVTRDPDAAKKYEVEVNSLKEKVDEAILNSPKERAAIVIANRNIRDKISNNPDAFDSSESYKKAKQVAMKKAREEVGASGKKSKITITDSEWEAIQNKAVSQNLLDQIIAHIDEKDLKERAMPLKDKNTITKAQIASIKAYNRSGYTNEDIATQLGISISAVIKYLKE